MQCRFNTTTSGSLYRHECRECGSVYVVKFPSLYANCKKDVAKTACGPGTELKTVLAKLGFTPKTALGGTCKCNERSTLMDSKGPQWCRDNLDTIVGWLMEEATARGYPGRPMLKYLIRAIVKKAIRTAEKNLDKSKPRRQN